MGAIWDGFVFGLQEVLKFFFSLPPYSAGLAIIFFTIAVKVILLPLTAVSLRSTREMQKLQPKIRELQKRYRDPKDRDKLNQETMKLYKEHGVNPTAGCLPSLLQIPIFFGVYYAILNLTRVPSLGALLGRWSGFASSAFLGLGAMPASIREGLSVGIMANQPFLWMANMGKPDPLHILPILAAGLQLLQQKMMATRDGDQQQNMMNNMMMLFPLLFLYIGWTFPAGPVLYWTAQSLVGMVQQYFTSGWGGLRQWFPFLPERKVSEKQKAERSRQQEAVTAGQPQQRRGWFWKMMDRVSSMQEQAAKRDGLTEGQEERAEPTAGPVAALPPAPEKRRAQRPEKKEAGTATESLDSTRCSVCQNELNFKRKVGGSVTESDELINALMRTAYRCRRCGAPICKSCTANSQCPQCGGKSFELDEARVR